MIAMGDMDEMDNLNDIENADETEELEKVVKTRRKIIYVDDIAFHLLATRERLRKYYEVIPAKSAEDLFKILRNIKPDLILLDINMPDTDGFEVIQQIKGDPNYAGIPVVFLTAQNDNDTVFKALNYGAEAYVTKPFATPSFIEQIEKIFNPTERRNPFEELRQKVEDPNKPCILAVDDVAMMLRSIHAALSDLYSVYTLNEPERLKEFLENIKPDLFLLDHNMPVLTGFDLIPIIRGFPEHKDTPIIFVTGDANAKQMVKAMDLGACYFIAKPINTKVLRRVIAEHIKKPTRTNS